MSLLERNSTIFLDFIYVEFITVAYNSDINKSVSASTVKWRTQLNVPDDQSQLFAIFITPLWNNTAPAMS